MTQEDKNLLLKDLCARLPYGVKVKLGEYLKNPYEEYCDWKWSSEDPNEIIITYSFLNYHDERDCSDAYITIEELSNFKPNNY